MGDKSAEVVGTGIAFLILPLTFVGLRFWARSKLGNHYGLDDWFIIPALLCSTATGICLLVAAYAAKLGQHHDSFVIPPTTPGGLPTNDPNTVRYETTKYIISFLGTLTIGFTKLSVLLLYRRLFSRVVWFRYLVDGGLVIIAIWTIAFSFSLLFQCHPVSYAWRVPEFLLGPYCFQFLKFYVALPVTDIITDILIVMMPIPMVWRLHLSFKQKLGVGGMFLLGTLVCAAGITRLAIFETSLSSFGSTDETYNAADAIVWTYIESSLAVVSACLPTLRPIFAFMKRESTTKGASYATNASGKINDSYSLKIFRGSKGDDSVNDVESRSGFVRVTSEWEVLPNENEPRGPEQIHTGNSF